MSLFTLQKAMEYASKDDVETWIHLFLQDEGNNVALSEGLQKQKRYWVGPIEMNISDVTRVVGPESEMEYMEDQEWWNFKITQIGERLKLGWDMPPLIAENRNGIFSIRDGNHRLGALEKLNHETCTVIIWDDHSIDNIMEVLQSKRNG